MDWREVALLILACSCIAQCKKDTHEENALREYRKFIGNGMLSNVAQFLQENEQYSMTRCALDILHWARSLNKFWSWQMMDANGKFPSGFLGGNFYSLGQYDECVRITKGVTKKNFQGKYCTVDLLTTNIIHGMVNVSAQLFPNFVNWTSIPDLTQFGEIPVKVGICIPSTCMLEEIKRYIQKQLWVDNINITKPWVRGIESMCSIKDGNELSGADIAAIVIYSLFLAALLFSTIYDLFGVFYYKVKEKNNMYNLLSSFSVYTNTQKLMKVNKSPSSLRCLNGIRVLSMLWVMLGHRYSTFASQPLENAFEYLNWIKTFPAYAVIASQIAVDSFFVMGGLLLAYVFFNQNGKKKSFNLGLYYLHRIIRLWPAMAALILLYSTVYYHLGSGPMWPKEIYHRNNCAISWWSALLYVQNYVHPNNLCAGHLWYLAVDTQIYFLSPILLYPLLRNRKIGIANMTFWILASQATCITIVYLNRWKAIMESDESYWNNFYYNTYMRCNVWLIGFATGYIMHRCKNKTIRLNKYFVCACWLVSMAIIGAVIFGLKPLMQLNHKFNHLEDSTYNAFAKSGWGIALCWIIFACVHGYGGPVNWLLSLRYLEIYGKLSYSMYLTHIMLQSLLSGSTRIARNFFQLDIVYVYFGDLVITTILAYIWVMTFELPFLNLEKVIFHKEKIPAISAHKQEERSPQDTQEEVEKKRF